MYREKDMQTVNAKIASTSFGIEDHGVLTFYLHLEWDGAGQGLGGYGLDCYKEGADYRPGFGPGLVAMRKIIETVGKEKWEDLPGTLVRLKVEGPGSSRTPIIGHIMKENWFDLKEFMDAQRKETT